MNSISLINENVQIQKRCQCFRTPLAMPRIVQRWPTGKRRESDLIQTFSSLVPHLIVLPTVAAIWIFSIVRFLRWVQFAFHLRLQSFLGVVDPGPVRAIRADSLHASPGRPLVTYFSFYAVHSSSIGDLVTHSLHWGYFALIEVIMFGLISTQLSSDIWSCLPKLPLLPGISHHFTSFNISHRLLSYLNHK